MRGLVSISLLVELSLCPNMSSPSERVPLATESWVFSLVFGWNLLEMSVRAVIDCVD